MTSIAKLTSHQKNIALDVLDCLVNNRESCILNGSAGTGKTFTANAIANELLRAGKRNVFISAPTHPALKVSKSKISKEAGIKGTIQFGTIHSYLKLQKKIVGDKEVFLPSSIPIIHSDILIIDEASMLDSQLYGLIKEHCNYPVIYIGDNKQLNPIGEDNSPIFEGGYDVFTLTEVIRQSEGSDIITLSNNLDLLKGYTDGINYSFHEELTDDLLGVLAEGNPFLTWTRKRAAWGNEVVRNYIHYNNDPSTEATILPQYIKGETIIFNRPYNNYKNNDRVMIHTLTQKKKSFLDESILLWVINHKIEVVHEEYKGVWRKLTNKFIKADNWKGYYSFIDKVADIEYSHGFTVHKSQGQTFNKIILDYDEVIRNPNKNEKRRMLYTAVTRPEEHVHILKIKR